MALTIYNNIYSMNAQRSLTVANNAQGKSLERLSSGLRINNAADDASGLAISERLRGQISGMKRATMNAQDGISYLQTAEGGMEEVTSILQRMRELAVQAGNGIYTTNDRQMLQLEVDQLKEEIDRITQTTEFNTKKLLDGSGTALWSSDKDFIKANVTGPSVPEGDYKIDTTMTPGTNSQYKSNIMSVKDGVLVSEITTGATNGSNVTSVRDPYNLPVTGNKDLRVAVGDGTVAKTQANIDANALAFMLEKGNSYKQDGSNWTVSSATVTWASQPEQSGYFEFEFLNNGTMTAAMTYRYRTINTNTNPPVPSNWKTDSVTWGAGGSATATIVMGTTTLTSGTTLAAGDTISKGAVIHGGNTINTGETLPAGSVLGKDIVLPAGFTLGAGSVFSTDTIIDGITYKAGQPLAAAVTVVAAATLPGTVTMGANVTLGANLAIPATSSIKLGDTMTLAANMTVAAGTTISVNSNVQFALPQVGNVKAGDKIMGMFERTHTAANWAQSGGGTIKVGSGPTIEYSAIGSLTREDNGNVKTDYNEVKITLANMDAKTGVVDYGSLTLEFEEQMKGTTATPGTGITKPGAFDVKIRDTGAATKDTKLSDIMNFTNSDGRMILSNTQELKIYANGTSTSIFLESDDTVEDFVSKLTLAMVEKLDVGAKNPISAVDTINENLVNYVPNLHQTDGTNEAIPGTFIIQSAKLGKDSNLVFIGDQGLISALALSTIQQGQNSSIDVKVTDATTGKFIGADNVNDGKMRSIIPGVEVMLEQNAGMDVSWNSGSKTMQFEQNVLESTGYLHLVDNRTELQIGANEGQTMNISVGRLDTTGLDITDVYVMDLELSQQAITKIDSAMSKVSAARATIGAQINRLEHTINNLSVAKENLAASESRIRDLDIAEETANFSRNQILVQASTAMVAQANQIPQQALTLLQGR